MPCTAKIDPNGQVGAPSWSLRFQRLLGGGTKTVRGRRPASRYKKLCSLNVCVGPNITVSRTPQAVKPKFDGVMRVYTAWIELILVVVNLAEEDVAHVVLYTLELVIVIDGYKNFFAAVIFNGF